MTTDEKSPLLPGERPSRVPGSVRWLIVCAVVAVALAVAIWPRSTDGAAPPPQVGAPSASVSPGQLADKRARAALPPCPTGIGARQLAGLPLSCLGDGSTVGFAAAANRPTLINVWAYWCGPCRAELPVLAEVAARAGDRLTVLTVHADPNAAAGLDLLAELHVKLATVSDPQSQVAALLGAPRAYPVTIALRPDGTVARVHSRPFSSVDDVASVLRDDLGVSL